MTALEYLSNYVLINGSKRECNYCGQILESVTIEEMATIIEETFEHHYKRTPTTPSDYEVAIAGPRRDLGWYRDGDLVTDAIKKAAGIPEKAAEDIQGILEAHKMGEECEFAADSRYSERSHQAGDWIEKWYDFERSLKTESRFFNQTGQELLQNVFKVLEKYPNTADFSPIVVAGPNETISHLYRARYFEQQKELKEALKTPGKELGPPPKEKARAGRMNAHGISVFYGADNLQTALHEIRPPVGSRVVVGKFDIIRNLRLLDLAGLANIAPEGSIFDPAYKKKLEHAAFLSVLSDIISKPITPYHEQFDYIPTQAIADFLSRNSALCIDGIIYKSSQTNGGGKNVILFHKALRVDDIPNERREVRMLYDFNIELDDFIEGFSPYEIYTSAKEDKPGGECDFLTLTTANSREVSLQLSTDSISVHHIKRIEIIEARYPVKYHD